MGIHWEKVLSDPLGLAGYALFLVFGILSLVLKRRKPINAWVLPAGLTLGALCMVSALGLAYKREEVTSAPPPAPALPKSSLQIDKVVQTVENGNAVTGVQGDVEIESSPPAKTSKPKL